MTTDRDLESILDLDYYGPIAMSFVSGMTEAEFAAAQKTITAVMYTIVRSRQKTSTNSRRLQSTAVAPKSRSLSITVHQTFELLF